MHFFFADGLILGLAAGGSFLGVIIIILFVVFLCKR